MIKEILNSISGIEIWPIIALFIFMALFIAVIVWAARLDKKIIKKMKELPLETDSTTNNGENRHG